MTFQSKKKYRKLSTSQRALLIVALIVILAWFFNTIQPPVVEHQHEETKSDKVAIESDIAFPDDVLDLGEFNFERVVDGDTIHIKEIKEPLRLLCVDTEESFKSNEEKSKELAEEDWDSYLTLKKKKQAGRPDKYSTPLGDSATEFAKDFFMDVEKVKLERDSLDRINDFFHRPLCYVFALKDNNWVNYSVELVRKGYSPYYAKYGFSLRYHDAFLQAENEARIKRIGIWDPKVKHYPDYESRITWWNERAETIKLFEEKRGQDENYFFIQNDTDWERIKSFAGKEMTIFGTIDSTRSRNMPYRGFFSHKQGQSVIVYTEDENLFETIKGFYFSEIYVYFTGVLEIVDGDLMMKFTDSSQLQIFL